MLMTQDMRKICDLGLREGAVADEHMSTFRTGSGAHLQLDREQLHVCILLHELGHPSKVLVGGADDVQNRQQLAQAHGEALCHPAAAREHPRSLASLFSSVNGLILQY